LGFLFPFKNPKSNIQNSAAPAPATAGSSVLPQSFPLGLGSESFQLDRSKKFIYALSKMKITMEIPDTSFSITRERPEAFARSLRIAAAVKWYELGRISQSKAAELIGCNRIELFNHLREYGVSFLQVNEDDLERELADSRI
jgi:predicted HTH domain antitoxin